jgi:hypothetical protein
MVAEIDAKQARRLLVTLRSNVATMVAKDAEQEVRGIAVQAVEAALSTVRGLIAQSPVMARVDEVISTYASEAGEPIRAVDVLLVVDLMLAELPPEPKRRQQQVWSPDLRTMEF